MKETVLLLVLSARLVGSTLGESPAWCGGEAACQLSRPGASPALPSGGVVAAAPGGSWSEGVCLVPADI